MLFREILDKLSPEVDAALDELFEVIKKSQTHEQDLLLTEINGFFDPRLEEPGVKKRFNLSPFVFGPQGWVYYADMTQYYFYDYYRRLISDETREAFFSDYKSNLEKQAYYEISLQIEMMVYLKFWESNRIIKKLYQLSNLAVGNNYDWYFNILQDDSRHKVIREQIREPIKSIVPSYYKLLKEIYLSQIRNAAAHSDFYIVSQKLGFNNYDPKNHAPLAQIDFIEWEERFHKLILLYNALIGKFKELENDYIKEQSDKHYGLQIRMTENTGKEKLSWIKYDVNRTTPDWVWYENWKKQY